jgi:hypothetical protein
VTEIDPFYSDLVNPDDEVTPPTSWLPVDLNDALSLDYSRDSGIKTASIRVKGLLNWEND